VQSATTLPAAGQWGCESTVLNVNPVSKYVDEIQSNATGEIKVIVNRINSDVNGKAIILQPSEVATGAVDAPEAGDAIASWNCGADPTNAAPPIDKFLPGSCRAAIVSPGGHAESQS